MAGQVIKLIIPHQPPLPAPRPKRAFWRRAKRYIPGLAVMAFLLGLAATVQTTAGVFSDDETSPPAIVNLGTLDFITATTTEGFYPPKVAPDQISACGVRLENTGNLPFQYGVAVEKTGGDENVCEFMQLEAYLGGTLAYRGGLLNFATSSLEYATTTADWDFKVFFPADALGNLDDGDECRFKLKFTGWQLAANDPDAGFFDHEEVNGSIRVDAGAPRVTVTYPNGGEHWFIVDDKCADFDWCRNWCYLRGMNKKCEYEITWDAKSGGAHPNSALSIDIWYSTDSGSTWLAKIADDIQNTGKFYWKIPYDLRFVSDKARIKVVARDKQDSAVWNWDQSDADFCPPLLSIEDLMNVSNEPVSGDAPEAATTTQSSQEVSISPMTIEEINRDINQIVNSAATSTFEILENSVGVTEAAIESAAETGSAAAIALTVSATISDAPADGTLADGVSAEAAPEADAMTVPETVAAPATDAEDGSR